MHDKQHDTQQQIKALKEQLDALNATKEEAFQQKESFTRRIHELLTSLKAAKTERDAFTQQVKEEKQRRDQLNEQIKQKIEVLKKLNESLPVEKNAVQPSPSSEQSKKHSESPVFLRRKIAALEKQIETGAISFEREKGYMKQINAMKKELAQRSEQDALFRERRNAARDVDVLRREAHAVHKRLQEKAGHSQQRHELLFSLSKELDETRIKEKAAYDTFSALKQQFNELNNQLKSFLSDAQVERQQRRAVQEKRRRVHEEVEKKQLAERREEVTEKLKKGKGVKLTMEDILAFQSGKD